MSDDLVKRLRESRLEYVPRPPVRLGDPINPDGPEAAERIEMLEEALADKRRLTRELDVEMHGDGAAKQASLCDLIGSVTRLRKRMKDLEAANQVLAKALSSLIYRTDTAMSVLLDAECKTADKDEIEAWLWTCDASVALTKARALMGEQTNG